MAIIADTLIRQATQKDQIHIENLLNRGLYVHRHMDWRNPQDWIGFYPYLVVENEGQIVALLACPQDPPRIAWIRLFAVSDIASMQDIWEGLWNEAKIAFYNQGHVSVAVVLTQSWLKEILESSGFIKNQQVIMLERNNFNPLSPSLFKEIRIRTMTRDDLPEVAEVDAAAFELLWQNTLFTLRNAYDQVLQATVAETKQGIVGYQLSTPNPNGAHLARLAVRPEEQGRGIGYNLVVDLIARLARRGIHHITVNTQNDNIASLTLYRKAGFHETGEHYPVFRFDL